MNIEINFRDYAIRLALEKRTKKSISYLPDCDVLEVLKKTDKQSFLSSRDAIDKLKQYSKYLSSQPFWEQDEGYDFIDPFLKESEGTILDIGSHVGQLYYFLKNKNYPILSGYSGTDLIESFLHIARENHTGVTFFKSDIQQFITNEFYDIVFTKGTIISTFNPIQSLENVLSVPSRKVFLIHTPISDCMDGKGYYNILVSDRDSVYSSSVFCKTQFFEVIKKNGFSVTEMKKRRKKNRVINKGSYFIYDLILERN